MKKAIFIIGAALFFLASCNDGGTVAGVTTVDSTSIKKEEKDQRNKATALASIDGFQKLDANVVLKDADASIVDYSDGGMAPVKGLDSNKAMLSQYLGALDHVKGSNLMAISDGDVVMIYGEWEGKFKSDFMGMKTAGKSYKFKDVDIFKFNDAGKIVEHRSVQNSQTVMAQMGITPPKQ